MTAPRLSDALAAASLLWLLAATTGAANAESLASFEYQEGAFALVAEGRAANIAFDPDDFPLVELATKLLGDDIEKVSGARPEVERVTAGPLQSGRVYVGAMGRSALVELLQEEGRLELELEALRGAWESYVIATLELPTGNALVILGSDRRGAAYGVLELSQAIGVSPWNWWADVPPARSERLYVPAGTRRFGPPTVKYRGIFINDEDWGLHPWAKYTFDPELGDIGPKTYEKVFELLLRLKANTLWPAMHEVTQAFNLYPDNKIVADRYGIVMGSSHAEPMLRNNVTEWSATKSEYNYASNADRVRDYWEERLVTNGRYENIYTLGMRGIHDSGMTAGETLEEKVAFLERIIEDQRELLRKRVNEDLTQVPQVFVPYKEVLDLYQAGLDVPEEVMIMWPDDNHGYIRTFPDERERSRAGGSGIYYHISYLGSPLAYLWLNTTPLALIWEELNHAYQLGARDYWILNVGDVKPGEIGAEFFLQMAWDIDRWDLQTQGQFLEHWARREFGPERAGNIAALMADYFELNFRRRPEHLQWWLPHSRARASDLTADESRQRVVAFRRMLARCESIKADLEPRQMDAFFQLVEYPVKASAFANLRYIHIEQYGWLFHSDTEMARQHGALAREADDRIKQLTQAYNEEVAGGKWRRMITEEPADPLWRSFRTMPPAVPASTVVAPVDDWGSVSASLRFVGANTVDAATPEVVLEAEGFDRSGAGRDGSSWRVIEGLGWSRDSISVFPVTAPAVEADWANDAAWVEYDLSLSHGGEYTLYISLLPTFPTSRTGSLRVAASLDGDEPVLVEAVRVTGDEAWKRSVLEGSVTARVAFQVEAAGERTLRLYMVDTGVVVDRLFLHQGSLAPSFSGPAGLER